MRPNEEYCRAKWKVKGIQSTAGKLRLHGYKASHLEKVDRLELCNTDMELEARAVRVLDNVFLSAESSRASTFAQHYVLRIYTKVMTSKDSIDVR